MKALVIYYTLTGQAALASDLVAATLREAGIEPTLCRVDFADAGIRPKRPFSFADVKRWSDTAAAGQIFPIVMDPPDAIGQSYDLIILFTNTWQHHPSPPIRSLLTLPEMKKTLDKTPFAIFVVSRRLWKKNADIVQREAEASSGVCIGIEHFGHHGGPIGSLFTTVTYMLGSGSKVMWPLPQYGLSDDSTSRVGPATRNVIAKVREWREKHL